jgi:hypothetical protein
MEFPDLMYGNNSIILRHSCWKPRHVARQWHNKRWRNNGTRHVAQHNQWKYRWKQCFYAVRADSYVMQQQNNCWKRFFMRSAPIATSCNNRRTAGNGVFMRSASIATSCNNRRTVGNGVLCWVRSGGGVGGKGVHIVVSRCIVTPR